MRWVEKKESFGSYHLQQAHQNPPSTPDEARSRWKAFRSHKAKVLKKLLDEQYGLCCYSEIRADLEDLDYHIEHVEPKGKNPPRTFDYANLAASALNSDDIKNRVKEDVFGGHAKLSQYDANLFISCHNPDCSRYFVYSSDGKIEPRENLTNFEKQQAIYTRDLLNLNCSYLVNRRKHYYEELEKLFEEHLDKNWSVEDLAAIDLSPTGQKLSQFFSLTRQFFGAVAEQVLQTT